MAKLQASLHPNKVNAFFIDRFPLFHAGDENPQMNGTATHVESSTLAFNYNGHDKVASDAALMMTELYSMKLPVPLINIGGAELTYDDIVSLAGDLFARFDDKDPYTGNPDGVAPLSLLDASKDDIEASMELGRLSSNPKASAAIDEKIRSAILALVSAQARHVPTKLTLSNSELRYGLLGLTNWDHFHPLCKTRYVALHGQAIKEATEAGRAHYGIHDTRHRDPAVLGGEAFRKALARNAFASHFLTDGFSRGHLVLGRKEHYQIWEGKVDGYIDIPSGRRVMWWEIAAGLQAQRIHDRKERLWVRLKEAPGSSLVEVTGDADFDNSPTYQNQVTRATFYSMMQIYCAFWKSAFPGFNPPPEYDIDPFTLAPEPSGETFIDLSQQYPARLVADGHVFELPGFGQGPLSIQFDANSGKFKVEIGSGTPPRP